MHQLPSYSTLKVDSAGRSVIHIYSMSAVRLKAAAGWLLLTAFYIEPCGFWPCQRAKMRHFDSLDFNPDPLNSAGFNFVFIHNEYFTLLLGWRKMIGFVT